MKFSKSLLLLKNAKESIPSAAQTYSKNYRYYCEGAAPAFLTKGNGCRVYDVDGNCYLDFALGLGPVTIGYNNARINKAITEQLDQGISFTLSHPLEQELASKIIDIVPCAQMVKFVKNGSDATTGAVRLARAFTGRDIILCSGYHGFHDWYVGTTTNNRGVPGPVADLTKPFKYNDTKGLEQLFRENQGKVAAIIMEPVSIEAPEPGFLEAVRKMCSENGSILIFDEVVTGFRLALGGAQEYFNITPDLCAMGKGIANGMPLSLIAGKSEIMNLMDQGAFISTTFGGETLSIAAALETIKIMEEEDYFNHIWHLGDLWLKKVDRMIDRKKASMFVKTAGLAPHSGVVFNDFGNILLEDFKTLFMQEIISRGILSLGINNYCLAHKEEHVEQYIEATECALDVCLQAVEDKHAEHLFKGGRFRPVFARN